MMKHFFICVCCITKLSFRYKRAYESLVITSNSYNCNRYYSSKNEYRYR